jgi:hypothetical protein
MRKPAISAVAGSGVMARPPSAAARTPVANRTVKIGAIHTYLELYARLLVDLTPRLALIVPMAMMAIAAVYEPDQVQQLNHGIGYATAAIELIPPTYAAQRGLKGKIARHLVLNPHPTLIPAIEAGFVDSVYCSRRLVTRLRRPSRPQGPSDRQPAAAMLEDAS